MGGNPTVYLFFYEDNDIDDENENENDVSVENDVDLVTKEKTVKEIVCHIHGSAEAKELVKLLSIFIDYYSTTHPLLEEKESENLTISPTLATSPKQETLMKKEKELVQNVLPMQTQTPT